MTLAGLRPGEKLFEEKLMAEEGLKKTKNKLIHIGCPIPFNTEQFESTVISITDEHLNFFRNTAILIIESLERAIHPDEYKVSNFNPYKL